MTSPPLQHPASERLGSNRFGVSAAVWHETDTTIGAVFEAVAGRTPGAMAVSDGERSLDYASLERNSRRLAAVLHASGAAPHAVVGVYIPIGALHVTAVLAIVRAGRIYVSLDPSYPESRLRAMVTAAHVERIVAAADLAPQAEAFGVPVVDCDAAECGEMTAVPPGPDSFAGLYFTSGSTGTPKVVAHTHRNVLFDIGRQTRDMGVTSSDRFDLLFSPSFSAFLSPVFGALLTGASVHIFDLKRNTIEALRDFLNAQEITVSTASVTTFRRLVGVLTPGRNLPRLRLLSLGAEPLRASDVEHFRTRMATMCVLQNALATTETRTIAQCYLRADEPAPAEVCIGRPVAGKNLRLLDAHGRPTLPGEPGEIVIESAFICPGAWEELRALPAGRLPAPRLSTHRTGDLGRFRADGQLVHLGRIDDQLKVRGHRIEAAEVESALLTHPAVRDAAVFVAAGPDCGADLLIALWVRRDSFGDSSARLRQHLRTRVPDYMVPNQTVEVPALPLTETGKLARRRLPEFWRKHASPNSVAKRAADSSAEPADDPIRSCWERVLGIRPIGEEDDFFALGGDSLAATELMATVSLVLGRHVPSGLLLTSPTLRTFRNSLQNQAPTASPDGVRRILLNAGTRPGSRPLYLVQPWNYDAWIFRDLGRCHSDREVWVVEGSDRSATFASRDTSIVEIAGLVARSLRRWHPDAGFDLAGYSMGGLVAWEVARQIHATLGVTPRVHLIDTCRYYARREPHDEAWVGKTRHKPSRLAMGLAYLIHPRGAPRWPIMRGVFLDQLRWTLWDRWFSAGKRNPSRSSPYDEVMATNIRLSHGYSVKPYAGPATLIRAHWQGDWCGLFSADLGWTGLCHGGLEIVQIDADHATILRLPVAAQVAATWTISGCSDPRGHAEETVAAPQNANADAPHRRGIQTLISVSPRLPQAK